jgi:hypothetical protein
MKYQLLTTDNRTLFVEYYLLEQFDDYHAFMELQYIFTIIPITINTYSYDYMKFIFSLVEHYLNNESDIQHMYETKRLEKIFLYRYPDVSTSNRLCSHINYYIIDCIEKNKICDFIKINNDLNNIRVIIIKLDNPFIICMINEFLDKFFTLYDIPYNIKDGVNNTSYIF